ncbi:indolepyruvate oxidoreductase subunit beta [Carboxylicivirga caseinilyticus]|uniref:indolepyruvate oxidoreductase subunit beta n=1 Tax=Carboxylicivirga caseinilyticus TaxID=3417572 RepID=UPI003D357485|nr:indolepyruvate oxidoreductase subunit beta [Marinilabiliaceae bacterium A049]
MKSDIVLAGVGGQGILSIAATLGMAAVENHLYLKQAEVHGMSQRGGDVQSHLRLSSEPVASDLIPKGKADIILSVEPMESLRYLPFLSRKGWLVTNITPFENIPEYPDMEKVMAEIEKLPHHIAIDADQIASEVGNRRASNIVMLGAASPFIDIPYDALEEGIRKIFSRKGEGVVEVNLKALRAGRQAAEESLAHMN